jgi:polar amino acid transport system permease protein
MLRQLAAELPRFLDYYILVFLLQAMLSTLLLSVLGCGLGAFFGFWLVYLRRSAWRWLLPLRVLAIAYVELFRRIPFLVILFIVMFATQAVGVQVSLFGIAVIGICIISTAFLSEIIRAGFDSVPRQQVEAAAVMNLTRWQAVRHVVLPQAWKVILPPAVAYAVMFIKDTSLASQFGVVELTFAGKVLNNRGFSALLVFGTILLLYFALSYPLTRLGQWLEIRLAPSRSAPSGQRVR